MNQPLEAATIVQHCKHLRMPTISAQFAKMADEAVKQKHSHISYLDALLTVEVEDPSGTWSRGDCVKRSFRE